MEWVAVQPAFISLQVLPAVVGRIAELSTVTSNQLHHNWWLFRGRQQVSGLPRVTIGVGTVSTVESTGATIVLFIRLPSLVLFGLGMHASNVMCICETRNTTVKLPPTTGSLHRDSSHELVAIK